MRLFHSHIFFIFCDVNKVSGHHKDTKSKFCCYSNWAVCSHRGSACCLMKNIDRLSLRNSSQCSTWPQPCTGEALWLWVNQIGSWASTKLWPILIDGSRRVNPKFGEYMLKWVCFPLSFGKFHPAWSGRTSPVVASGDTTVWISCKQTWACYPFWQKGR